MQHEVHRDYKTSLFAKKNELEIIQTFRRKLNQVVSKTSQQYGKINERVCNSYVPKKYNNTG